MKISLTAWTTIFASLAALPAFAADASSYEFKALKKNNLIISVGRATEQNGCASPVIPSGFTPQPPCSEKGTAYNIAYDYRFNQIFGMELSYGQTGKATANGTSVLGNSGQWAMRALTSAIYATATVPLIADFSLKGKVGLAHTHFGETLDTTLNGKPYYLVSLNGVPAINAAKNTLAYGLGVQYDFNRDVGVLFEYDNLGSFDEYSIYGVGTQPKINLSSISLGLVMKW